MADDLTEVRAALVHVSQEAADLESFAVDLGVKLKETEAERNNLAFEKRTVAAELEKTRMRLAAAEAERDALKALVREILSQFQHSGHPGEPCRRTGWIREKTIDGWCAALDHPTDTTGETP